MDNMLTSMPHLFLGIGVLLLILEVLVGFTTVLMMTLGLSMMITSGLMYADILEENMLHAFIAVAVLDSILLAILYRPMKKMQHDKAPNEVKSDLIGNTFDVDSDIEPGQRAMQKYSGVNWQIKCQSPLKKGELVKITHVDVGVLHVEPIQ
ncbi:NfeD family protein [Alteromonas facilis]|uniref:NfeD family protein n=1 Tax=Alteromonas facilis TaxID=2048004 RepID=UPI000C295638|nr:NfeD family protein [Alteromonas facilis]